MSRPKRIIIKPHDIKPPDKRHVQAYILLRTILHLQGDIATIESCHFPDNTFMARYRLPDEPGHAFTLRYRGPDPCLLEASDEQTLVFLETLLVEVCFPPELTDHIIIQLNRAVHDR